MSNLADLKVGLLLNDVSFRTQIADAYRHAGSESERFSRKVSADNKKSEESFASLSKSINSVAGKLALISGTGLSLGAIINTTRQYSQSLSDLASITGATKEQMVLFDEAAQEMGRTTQFSAMQGAEAIKLMASAKPDLMKTSSGLIDVTKSALILAQASGTTLPDATRTLALSLNQFGASVADTDRYINVLAAGAKYGSSEVNETSEAIKKSGVAAANAKMSFEELNAAIQTLAEREVKGSDAGTALRNMILKLEARADKNLKPSVVGLGGALENLGKKNYSTTALTKLFGLENVNTAMILSQNAKKVKELTQALTGTDTAYEQAKERTNNLNGDLLGLTIWNKQGKVVFNSDYIPFFNNGHTIKMSGNVATSSFEKPMFSMDMPNTWLENERVNVNCYLSGFRVENNKLIANRMWTIDFYPSYANYMYNQVVYSSSYCIDFNDYF